MTIVDIGDDYYLPCTRPQAHSQRMLRLALKIWEWEWAYG